MIQGLIIDSFAGGGGASTGIEMALERAFEMGLLRERRFVDYAVNHDAEAIAMHAANHPNTHHLNCNVWQVEFDQLAAGRRVALMWFSPDCKHFSKAKGGKPVTKNIRDLAWVAIKAVRQARPEVIFLENVEEFQDWGPLMFKRVGDGRTVGDVNLFEASEGQRNAIPDDVERDKDGNPVLVPDPARKGQTFRQWTSELVRMGYQIEWRELKACDYGAPTIRKRFFMIARCDGKRIVWPKPTHADPKSEAVKNGELKPWRTAAEIIDWSLDCPSIFMTKDDAAEYTRRTGKRIKRPLVENTMNRVGTGTFRYVINDENPFIVNLTHQGGDRTEDLNRPANTVTGAHRGEKAIVVPHVTKFRANSVGSAMDEPAPTVTANSFIERPGGAAPLGIVTPTFVSYGQQGGGNRRADEPLHTATASTGDQNQVVAPVLVGVGGRAGQSPPRAGDMPTGTGTAKADVALITPQLMTVRNGSKQSSTGMAAHLHLVAAFLAQHNIDGRTGKGNPGHGVSEPVSTILSSGSHQGLAAIHMMDMHGSDQRGAAADEPLRALTAGGWHAAQVAAFLIKYYGTDQDPQLREALHTITTKDRFGLVTVTIRGEPYIIVDIGLRMLVPRELFRAQGFPDSYIIDKGRFAVINRDGDREWITWEWRELTDTAQVRMCGNSVCPQLADALIWANLIEDTGSHVRPRPEVPMEMPLWPEDAAA